MFGFPQGSEIVVVGLIGYVLVMLLAIFIGYLIMKAAVKNGTLQAMRQARNEGLIR